uniref:Arylsulfatase n=1 Tax=Blastobotrys adeninivorans TaxID=409370 RepID=A0A060TCD7_BLAAD
MRYQVLNTLVGLAALSQQAVATDYELAKPNILFILTDDQDRQIDSLKYMPKLQKYLVQEGTEHVSHYCTTALCCPSRVSLLRGQMAHNTNVTDVKPPYGGFPQFVANGLNDYYLPHFMAEAGYDTYYIGKIINSLTTSNYKDDFMKGWTDSEIFLDPFTYQYYNVSYSRNGAERETVLGTHSSDLIANHTSQWLSNILNNQKKQKDKGEDPTPFFFVAAPVSCHSEMDFSSGKQVIKMPQYPNRYANYFNNVTIPRTPNFNPDEPSGASWVRDLEQLEKGTVDMLDEYYRARLRSLQPVDEMIESLVNQLDRAGVLDNTYIVFSSDNGFHLGQHRCGAGKGLPYESDVNVPFVIRGPGIAKNETNYHVSGHVDLAPTFLKLAGADPKDFFDGKAMDIYNDKGLAITSNTDDEFVQVEFWSDALGENPFNAVYLGNNSYKALRLISPKYNLYYSVWCTGEHELYDMTKDPYQMSNLLLGGGNNTLLGTTSNRVAQRLDGLLLVLKDCKSDACRAPWSELHPDHSVNTLQDALATEHDDFYKQLPDVRYKTCLEGYILANEGPIFEQFKQDHQSLFSDTAT